MIGVGGFQKQTPSINSQPNSAPNLRQQSSLKLEKLLSLDGGSGTTIVGSSQGSIIREAGTGVGFSIGCPDVLNVLLISLIVSGLPSLSTETILLVVLLDSVPFCITNPGLVSHK